MHRRAAASRPVLCGPWSGSCHAASPCLRGHAHIRPGRHTHSERLGARLTSVERARVPGAVSPRSRGSRCSVWERARGSSACCVPGQAVGSLWGSVDAVSGLVPGVWVSLQVLRGPWGTWHTPWCCFRSAEPWSERGRSEGTAVWRRWRWAAFRSGAHTVGNGRVAVPWGVQGDGMRVPPLRLEDVGLQVWAGEGGRATPCGRPLGCGVSEGAVVWGALVGLDGPLQVPAAQCGPEACGYGAPWARAGRRFLGSP